MAENRDVRGTDVEQAAVLRKIIRPLSLWYQKAKRDLPWRTTKDPYRIWVSEIMLQQTRVEAVKSYYERFLDRLPTADALASCSEDELLKLWEGLGYYSRVKNMQKAARQICTEYGGRMPETAAELKTLCGIGDYTAGAVASIAFAEPVPAVDGNVLRVVSRIMADPRDVTQAGYRKALTAALTEAMESVWKSRTISGPEITPGEFNQGMMDLGAVICVPKGEPHCLSCPLQAFCRAHGAGEEDRYPVRAPKKKRKKQEKTVLLIRDGDRIALRKRPEKGLLAGMYELPNLDGYLSEKAVLAYMQSAGLDVLRIRPIGETKHIFTHVEWHMKGYELQISAFPESRQWIFAETEEISRRYAVPSAFAFYTGQVIRGNEK